MPLETVLVRMAERTTRQSVINLAGKLTLAAVGVGVARRSLSELTPKKAEAYHECGYWHVCGLCGPPCGSCGGTGSSCPAGTYVGSAYWSKCCCAGGNCQNIYYYDCCSASPTGTCTHPACTQGCPQADWCPGWVYDPATGQWWNYIYYTCTVIFGGSSC